MRTDNDWLEDGCLECGATRFRESELAGVCDECYDELHGSTEHGPRSSDESVLAFRYGYTEKDRGPIRV